MKNIFRRFPNPIKILTLHLGNTTTYVNIDCIQAISIKELSNDVTIILHGGTTLNLEEVLPENIEKLTSLFKNYIESKCRSQTSGRY